MKMKQVPSKHDLLCFVTIFLVCYYFLIFNLLWGFYDFVKLGVHL